MPRWMKNIRWWDQVQVVVVPASDPRFNPAYADVFVNGKYVDTISLGSPESTWILCFNGKWE